MGETLVVRIANAIRANPDAILVGWLMGGCSTPGGKEELCGTRFPLVYHVAPKVDAPSVQQLRTFSEGLLPGFSPEKAEWPVEVQRRLRYDERPVVILNFGKLLYMEHVGTVTDQQMIDLAEGEVLRERLLEEGWVIGEAGALYAPAKSTPLIRKVEVVTYPTQAIARRAMKCDIQNIWTASHSGTADFQRYLDRDGVRISVLKAYERSAQPKRGNLIELLGLPV